VQHLECFAGKVRFGEADADVLGGAGKTRIQAVDVEVAVVDHVARDDRALEEVHVVECVDEACKVVEVEQRGVAVVVVFDVDHVHRRTGGAEVYAAAAEVEIVLRVASV